MYTLAVIILFFIQAAQPYEFKKYDVSDGLSNNIVHDVYQDVEGFLWVATENGLNRFDGHTFKVFKHDPTDSTSISHNIVMAVFEDQHNRLWVGTWNGLNLFDRENQQFKRFLHIPELGSFRISSNFIPVDNQGKFWYPVSGGFFRFDPVAESFELIRSDFGLSGEIPLEGQNQLMIDNAGAIWLYNKSVKYLGKFEESGRVLDRVKYNGEDQYYYAPDSKTIWFTSVPGTESSIPLAGYLPEISDSVIPQYFLKEGSGSVWIGTDQGVFYRDKQEGSFKNITAGKLGGGSLSYHVEKLYEDRWGGIWIGTRNGLFHYNPLRKPFYHLNLPGTEQADAINESNIVMALEKSEDRLWIGNLGGGLYWYDLQTGIFRLLEIDKDNEHLANQVWDVFRHSSYPDILWLATTNGLYRYNIKTEKSNHVFLPYSEQHSPVIFSIIEGGNSFLWIGGNYDVYKVNAENGNLIDRISLQGSVSTIQDLHIYEDNQLYITTQGAGIFAYDLQKNQLVPAFSDSSYNKVIEKTPVWDIYESKNQMLWLATGDGLFSFNPETGGLNHTFKTQNVFYSIREDQQGRLWIGSDHGLYIFSPQENEFRHYDGTDGLINEEFNRRAAMETSDGFFWFGGTNGITWFNPLRVQPNPFPLPTHITSFKIFEENGERELPGIVKNPVELSWFENTFEISFTAIDFTNPAKIQYQYRMAGVDPGWITESNQNSSRYTNLRPGEYTFEVQAANSDKVWNEVGASLAIKIHPPFWQTNWAYAIYVLLLVTGIFGFIKYRTRVLETERKKLEGMVQERTKELNERNTLILEAKRKIETQAVELKDLNELKSRFFANISHELRTPLTLIDAPLQQILSNDLEKYPAKKLYNKLEGIRRNSKRLAKLIDELLAISRSSEGRMELKPVEVNITNWFSLFIDSYQSLAASKRINFSVKQELSSSRNLFLDLEKFDKITSNLVNNALKFTPQGGDIEIKLEVTAGELNFRVTDTGKGISDKDFPHIFDRFYRSAETSGNTEEGLGLGLALSKELAGLLGGTLKVKSKEGEGSEFTLTIPVVPAKVVQEKGVKKIHNPLNEPVSDKNKLLKVLVVEDNAEMRSLIIQLLNQDFEVFAVQNGKEALKKLKTITPNLILSDLMMPVMDGLELTKQLRSVPHFSHIPVLMLTARSSDKDRMQSLRIGVDDYLSKPFIPEEVTVRALNLAKNHKKRMELIKGEAEEEPGNSESELQKIQALVEKHLSDHNLTVSTLAELLYTSERQLYRKMQKLTGMTPIEYLNSLRLNKARYLLISNKKLTIDRVSHQVGFKSRSYFSRLFKKAYGISPGHFQSEK